MKFWGKTKALELLCRREGLFKDTRQVEVTRREEMAVIIGESRQRWKTWEAEHKLGPGDTASDTEDPSA